MTKLISREEVKNAGMAVLIEQFNILNPDAPVKRFSSVEAGCRRVDMSLMAAKDVAAHKGVKKGEKPVAVAPDASKKAGKAKSAPAPKAKAEKPAPDRILPKLRKDAAASLGKERKAAAGTGVKRPRVAYWGVQAAESGNSKPHAGSVRNALLQMVKNNSPISLEKLQQKFEKLHPDAKIGGYLQKLAEKGHVKMLEVQPGLEEAA